MDSLVVTRVCSPYCIYTNKYANNMNMSSYTYIHGEYFSMCHPRNFKTNICLKM